MGMSDSNLEDRAAIHDLFTRYCCALDNGEIEAVVDCFTLDAVLKSPVIDISGHDEILAFAGRFAAQRAAGTQLRHMVSNVAVTIAGNRAAASAFRTTASLPHPGQRTPSGQWCWRTKAKHFASSSRDARFTGSTVAMLTGPPCLSATADRLKPSSYLN